MDHHDFYIANQADVRPSIVWELTDDNYVTPTIVDSNFADQILKPLVDKLIAEYAIQVNHPAKDNPIVVLD